MFTNESEAYDSASVVPIRSELSSDSDSAYDSASDSASVALNELSLRNAHYDSLPHVSISRACKDDASNLKK